MATATAGTVAVGIAIVGYFVRPVGLWQRLLLALGGIGLLIPPGGTIAYSWLINSVSGVICLAIILYEWRARKASLVSQEAVAALE